MASLTLTKKKNSAEAVIDITAIHRLKKLDKKNEPSFTKELIESFLQSTPEDIKHMRKYCEINREPEVTYGAHKLKSSSANLGAMQFSNLCATLEEQSKNKNFEAMSFLLDNLSLEYKLVEIELIDIAKSLL